MPRFIERLILPVVGVAIYVVNEQIVEPAVRGAQRLPWIPEFARNTTSDSILAAGLSIGIIGLLNILDEKLGLNTAPKLRLAGGAIIALTASAVFENIQGVRQTLHQIDGGFAWIDYPAYAVGAGLVFLTGLAFLSSKGKAVQ